MSAFLSTFAILVFNAIVDHGHILVIGTREEAGLLAHRIRNALRWALGRELHFLPIPPRPLDTAKHLENAMHYVLRQVEHHGAMRDPLHTASNLGDYLGYRLLAVQTRQVLRSTLPSFRTRDLLVHLGDLELVPGTELRHLGAAAAAAMGIPAIEGRGVLVASARLAAAHVARSLDASTKQTAHHLGITPRAVRVLLAREPQASVVKAIALQIGLREQIGTLALRKTHPSAPELRSGRGGG